MSRGPATNEQVYLTPPEVARILRVDVHSILAFVRNGELLGTNVARRGSSRPRWRIHRADLEAFLASRAAIPPPPRGPPRKRKLEYQQWV
jgi:excisionase family DNA binding protein